MANNPRLRTGLSDQGLVISQLASDAANKAEDGDTLSGLNLERLSIKVTLQSDWVAVPYSGSYVNISGSLTRARRLPDGRIELQLAATDASAGAAIGTLPLEFRPSQELAFASKSNFGLVLVTITTAGLIQIDNSTAAKTLNVRGVVSYTPKFLNKQSVSLSSPVDIFPVKVRNPYAILCASGAFGIKWSKDGRNIKITDILGVTPECPTTIELYLMGE